MTLSAKIAALGIAVSGFLIRVHRRCPRLHFALLSLIAAYSVVVSLVSGEELRYPDEREYHRLAITLNRGQGFVRSDGSPTAFNPPGYPFVLSLAYRVHESPMTGKLLNTIFLLISAVLLYGLASKASRLSGEACLILLILYPLIFYAASTLYPQVVGSVLLVLSLMLAIAGERSRVATAASGLTFGALVLTIPACLLVLPLVLFGLLVITRLEARKRWIRVSFFLAALTSVIVPWSIRNYAELGHPILVSSNSGINLLLGNSENTTPNSGVNVDISSYRRIAEELSEVDRDRYFRDEAIRWIAENTTRALGLYVQKVLNYFNFRNEMMTESESGTLQESIVAISYYPILLLVIIRSFAYRRFPFSDLEKWFILLYVGNAFVSALFFTRIRFRIPFDLLLVCLAGVFIGRLIDLVNDVSLAKRTPS